MEFNPEIGEILTQCNIKRDAGKLFLLGIYFDLDVDTVCSEQLVKSMALTKIVEKDYQSKTIKWNVPLFTGQDIDFAWVRDWMEAFGRVNPERKGAYTDAVKRMKDFFAKNPAYRKDDVYKARDLYLSTLNAAKYCMHSHKFIYDGVGVMKKSTLLQYCERLASASVPSQQRGQLIT